MRGPRPRRCSTTSRAGSYPFALTGINLGKLMVDLLLLRDVQPQDITDAEDPGPTLLRCWQTPMVALFCQLPPETEDVFTDVFGTLQHLFVVFPVPCLSGDSRLLVLGAQLGSCRCLSAPGSCPAARQV